MVRSPREGEVKKRLAMSIGAGNAVELYRRFGLDILDAIKDRQFDVMIGYFPPEDDNEIISWLGGEHGLVPQTGEDLGERQASLLEKGFKLGYSRVCVMISDSPDIPVHLISSAFEVLSGCGCVIGPSPDGGYYLIGFTEDGYRRGPFLNMEWSNSNVVEGITGRLKEEGILPKMLEPWPDIDELKDLRDLISRYPEGGGPIRTMEFLRGLELP
jgi:rSAM/selenodomain-associated transferase 1